MEAVHEVILVPAATLWSPSLRVLPSNACTILLCFSDTPTAKYPSWTLRSQLVTQATFLRLFAPLLEAPYKTTWLRAETYLFRPPAPGL